MASLISILKSVDYLIRGGMAAREGIKAYQKAASFDIGTWNYNDYIEFVSKVGRVVAEVTNLKSSWNVGILQEALSNKSISQEEEKALSEAITLLKRKIHQNKLIHLTCHVIAEVSERRTILDVLCSRSTLYRLGLIAEGTEHSTLGTILRILSIFEITFTLQTVPSYLFPTGTQGLTLPNTFNYATLPPGSDQDTVFRQYICPITLDAIRYPVALRSGTVTHYFELSAIYTWVNKFGTNPMDRAPVQLQNLRIDVAVLTQIQNRMTVLRIPL